LRNAKFDVKYISGFAAEHTLIATFMLQTVPRAPTALKNQWFTPVARPPISLAITKYPGESHVSYEYDIVARLWQL
jgi:hypothetical protein